jgi:threonine/homoserine/homoserine lactone efflux protein
MGDFSGLFIATLTGFIGGFLICIPVGPINITIINEGAKRGFFWAVMIGAGAMVMDVIYCSVAFAGFSGLFASRYLRAAMELVSFLLTLYLGVKYMVARDLPATTKTMERVEHSLHPHTAFWIGFVRVLGNPAVLLFWITLSATFISHEWIEDNVTSKAACITGNFMGGMVWFLLLSALVSRGHGRFSTKTLVRLSHGSGASLLIVAVFIGFRLIRLLAHR